MKLYILPLREGILSLLILFLTSFSLLAQDLEVSGKLKVKQTQMDNAAPNVVVKLNDGTFAIRDATTFGGATGNGIANVVDNENGTFTFNFTNGGSFTTPVLTGPQGAPGNDGLSSVQTLSLTTSNITLSDGGGTVSINDADADPANELQTISKSGSTVTLSNSGGSFQDDILTETQVDLMVDNNGYVTTEVDGDASNELQTISKSGSTVTLSNSGGSFQDEVLTEIQVDLMVDNNGYLTQELDAGWVENVDKTSTTNSVGIGIPNPDAELHVAGSVKIVDGSQGDRKILTSDADGLATWTAEVPPTAQPIPLKYQGDLIYVHPVDNGTSVDWASAKIVCTALIEFGHSDWYLPTLSELNAMYKQSYLITGLDETASTKYWSDTEKDASNSFSLRLDYGGPDPDLKTTSANHNARCIRKN